METKTKGLHDVRLLAGGCEARSVATRPLKDLLTQSGIPRWIAIELERALLEDYSAAERITVERRLRALLGLAPTLAPVANDPGQPDD